MKHYTKNRIIKCILKMLLIVILLCFGFVILKNSYTKVHSPVEKTTVSVKKNDANDNYITAVEKPEYEVKKVYKLKKKKKLSEHSITNYSSGVDRNTNLAIACEIINSNYKGGKGYLLKPGESFDWYEVIGNTTKKKGYKKAGVILNHQHAEALGGGVCQVASTLNSAAVKAHLETESEKHSLTSTYLREGIDYEATVAYNPVKEESKNLVIKNTKKYPILIKAKAEGQTVKVDIFKMKKELVKILFIPVEK